MNIFGTKTTKNQILRVKLLQKIIFWKNFTSGKNQDFESLFTFWPISKQTVDVQKKVEDIEWPAINGLRFG